MPRVTKRRKNLEALRKEIEGPMAAPDALKMLKKEHSVKFDPTIEVSFRLGIDTKVGDQNIRSAVSLPGGTGKEVRVAVVAKGDKVREATEAGADVAGSEDLVEKIGAGFLAFDKLVATPDCMAMLSKMGKVLGPKGLMPNPKDGTVTADVGKTVKELKSGKVSLRAEKDGGVVQVGIGKLSFEDDRILSNLAAVYEAVQKLKPASVKGIYIKSVHLSSTMGPGIKLDLLRLPELSKHAAA
jgi:large subunit ribosomal protein L1